MYETKEMTTKLDAPIDAKARIIAIMQSPEAHGRMATAQHLALETDISVENALRVLKSIPSARVPAHTVRFPL